jgi:hypothetical protein
VTYLIPLGTAVVLFVAMPWLAAAFSRYCNAVNRFLAKRNHRDQAAKAGKVCSGYRLPATSEDSGLCSRCGMYDYKHQEATGA